MSEKPILMSNWSINRILSGNKTHTSRVIRVQPSGDNYQLLLCVSNTDREYRDKFHWGIIDESFRIIDDQEEYFDIPWKIGDVLYVKERWATCQEFDNMSPGEIVKRANEAGYETGLFSDIWYDADGEHRRFFDDKKERGKRRNSLYMPKRGARLWLEVDSIKYRRLQDMTEKDCVLEGIEGDLDIDSGNVFYRSDRDWFPNAVDAFKEIWNDLNECPKPVRKGTELTHYISYPWESIKEEKEYRGKKWFVLGNPYVYDIGFRVISKEGVKNENF